MQVFVNARFLTQPITGVQRYAVEVSKELKHLRPELRFLAPQNVIHHELAEQLGVERVGCSPNLLRRVRLTPPRSHDLWLSSRDF